LGFGQNHQIYNGDGTDRVLVSGGVLRATVPTTAFQLELTGGEIRESPLEVRHFDWSGGTLTSSNVNADGIVTLTGSLVMSGSTVTSNVIGSWSPSDLDEWFLDNSAITSNGEFTVDIVGVNEMATISGFDSRFDNLGEFVKTGPGRLNVGAAMRNEELGTIEVEFGGLALANPDTSLHGTVTVNSPATLEMSAGTLQSDGVITGEGDLLIGGNPAVHVNGQIDELLGVTIVGEVQLNRGQSVGAWFLNSSSTISGPGNLVVPVGGNLNMSGGRIVGSGILQIEGEALLHAEEGFPGDQTLNRQVVVNGGLQVLNSAVTLGAGASIVVHGTLQLTGDDDVTFLDSEAQIINQGETLVSTETATTTFGVDFVNRGELRITNGAFSPATGGVVFQKAFRQESGRLLYSAGTLSMDLIDLAGGTLLSSSDALAGVTSQTITAPLLGGPTSVISLEDVTIEVLPGFPVLVPGADLTIGDATRFDGFRTEGTIRTVDRTLTLHSAGFASLGVLTELDGGSLIAANGVALGIGDNISGHGMVDARVVASLGSNIVANGGDLEAGNATELDGFTSEGALRTNENTITLHDANEAVLGSLTTIGAASADGTLVAENGLIIEFGKSVTGRGLIDSQDDSSKPVINNGLVQGESPTNPIVMDGYVKGVGSFDNVTFTGTHAPGLSPAALLVGNIVYSDTATLALEIGGTITGNQFDQINSTGTIMLDGDLAVQLTGGFSPDEGDLFDILTATGGISGTFDTLPEELPSLAAGLQWQINYSANNVMLAVVSAGLLGDYNNNGTVDAADYTLWRKALAAGSTSLTNDPTPGAVDETDFEYWRAHFGETLGSGAGSAAASSYVVPEQCSPMLALFTWLGLAATYRRRISSEKSSRPA
jgi:hypothetical protein